MFIQLQNNILQFISQEGLHKDIHAVYIYIQIAQTLCTKNQAPFPYSMSQTSLGCRELECHDLSV